MKFAIVVVMLALAVGAQSSILAAAPWGVWGAGVHGGPWGGPWAHGPAAVDITHHGLAHAGLAHAGLAHAGLAHAGLAHAGLAHAGLAHPGLAHVALAHHGAWGGHPGIALSQGPGHLGLGHLGVHGHGHDGVYVAKTRGAIHTAPLAGHIASATSVNVAPAPGTH